MFLLRRATESLKFSGLSCWKLIWWNSGVHTQPVTREQLLVINSSLKMVLINPSLEIQLKNSAWILLQPGALNLSPPAFHRTASSLSGVLYLGKAFFLLSYLTVPKMELRIGFCISFFFLLSFNPRKISENQVTKKSIYFTFRYRWPPQLNLCIEAVEISKSLISRNVEMKLASCNQHFSRLKQSGSSSVSVWMLIPPIFHSMAAQRIYSRFDLLHPNQCSRNLLQRLRFREVQRFGPLKSPRAWTNNNNSQHLLNIITCL